MSVMNKGFHEGHEKCIKMLQQKQYEFKKMKGQLEQKIQFTQEKLNEYEERQRNNKKINQSIMSTYQQNENIRQQHVVRQINILSAKHQNQIKKLKQIHEKQTKQYQQNLSQFKTKYQQALLQIERKSIQFDVKILELKKKFEIQLKRQLEQKQKQMQTKLQMLNQKLKQSEGTAEIYKQFMQQRRETYQDENFRPSKLKRQSYGYRLSREQSERKATNFEVQYEPIEKLSRQSRINDIKENNIQDRKRLSRSKESVKQLTMKIDRALTQLKGSNTAKLHERINQKLSKRLR